VHEQVLFSPFSRTLFKNLKQKKSENKKTTFSDIFYFEKIPLFSSVDLEK
jgi:hypothetical protein